MYLLMHGMLGVMVSGAPTVELIITTKKLRQFFQEIGRSSTGNPLPVTSEDLAQFCRD